ncbi:hypothetical protein PCASD_15259 [Puccinia coronata f. sp. avenae]|uniref:Core-binding (CB) domain-containing protein n=1 Tax=Puccinia coronata f. sp. avenae TaxID=200324 RepID=A0A2N5TC90_9BASI|nr:hypothetical protein PCASD_15259 [Puccinia coronata f. sp. avenae]
MHKQGVASLQPSFRRLRPAPHIPSGHLTTARPRGRAGKSGSSPDAPVLARGFNSPAGLLLVGISGRGKRSFPLSICPHRASARCSAECPANTNQNWWGSPPRLSDAIASANAAPGPLGKHMLGGWKQNTLVAYNARVKKFLKYKQLASETPFNLPATKDNIVQFCFWAGKVQDSQAAHEVTAQTISRYLFALKAWHLFHNQPFPQDALPQIVVLLCSSKWVDAFRPLKEKKGAVKVPHLLVLVDKLAKGTERDKVLSKMAIVAFWALARLAELTYHIKEGPVNPLKFLLALDIAYATSASGRRQAWLRLCYTKTGKPGVVQRIQLAKIGGLLCPFAAVHRRHLAAQTGPRNAPTMHTHTPTDSLFGLGKGKQCHNITKGKAVRRFQVVFSQAGILRLFRHSFWVTKQIDIYPVQCMPSFATATAAWASPGKNGGAHEAQASGLSIGSLAPPYLTGREITLQRADVARAEPGLPGSAELPPNSPPQQRVLLWSLTPTRALSQQRPEGGRVLGTPHDGSKRHGDSWSSWYPRALSLGRTWLPDRRGYHSPPYVHHRDGAP